MLARRANRCPAPPDANTPATSESLYDWRAGTANSLPDAPVTTTDEGYPNVTEAHVIRDALYDLIPVDERVRELLETPQFIRLAGIQQLGFVSSVWPGARHTRFEHSIGVMHLTRKATDHLRQTADGRQRISDADADTITAAALLHDIGHYPFSHAIEELGPPIRSHEEVGTGIILRSGVADVLRDVWNVDPRRVAALVHGDDALTPADRLTRRLLSGTLDMDKLDYLPRDARACNVPYGGVDTERLIASLTIVELDGQPVIGITDKGISPLHSLINARQEMFDNVYWHHTNRASMVMLLRAVQDALTHGTITANSLTDHTDASLLAFLRSGAVPEETRALADALALRRIHKRAIEISAGADALYTRLSALWNDAGKRRAVELALVDRLGAEIGQQIPPTAILIDIPKPEKWSTDVLVWHDDPPVGLQALMHWWEVVGLDHANLKSYEEHRRLIRIVADRAVRDDVRRLGVQGIIDALDGTGA